MRIEIDSLRMNLHAMFSGYPEGALLWLSGIPAERAYTAILHAPDREGAAAVARTLRACERGEVIGQCWAPLDPIRTPLPVIRAFAMQAALISGSMVIDRREEELRYDRRA